MKASAGEVIQLYCLLRHWVETRLPTDRPEIARSKRAFLLACKAVDILLLAKRRSLPLSEASVRLRLALTEFLKEHVAQHGVERVRPKHHWAFDIAETMATDHFLFDAFVIERLHLRVRNIADNVSCMASFERSVLSGVLNDHARRASSCVSGGGLLGQSAPFPDVPTALISDKLEWGGFRAAVGDVVFYGQQLGVVVACCIEESVLYVVVELAELLRTLSPHCSCWREAQGGREIWLASTVSECATWQRNEPDEILALRI